MNLKILTFLLLFFSFLFEKATCQSFVSTDTIKLESINDFKTNEHLALKAADFVISKQFRINDYTFDSAKNFLLRWFKGTPEFYKYPIVDIVLYSLGNDEFLTAKYYAFVIKTTLENSSYLEFEIIKNNSIELFLEYCENPTNKIKMPNRLKNYAKEFRKKRS